MSELLWLIPGLPLLGCLIIAALGPGALRRHSHWPCILMAAASCVFAFAVLNEVKPGGESLRSHPYIWFNAGGVTVTTALQADALTAIMLVTITFIGTLIAIFSIGYMCGDDAYVRYFAFISLFLFSMTGLVLADNLILLFAFWEGVGLCSYFLIGHWYRRPSAAAAARKAFLVTRLGDAGFIAGIFLLWAHLGHTFDYQPLFARARESGDTELLTAACLLLFCGAVGKSAQFPLHVWLPDAMEGPTPVSALIHAATMVTAGVYLLARCMPLFVLAPTAQIAVACIGAFTALLAALIALTQNDLKRILAYSTVSQLGYMFLALGCGVSMADLPKVAIAAALFHLFTHAFFKALLFLSAGGVMHSMGDVIDIRRFGGLRKVMPITHVTFLCGAAALAGLPPFSGFWSKDQILSTVLEAGEKNPTYHTLYVVLFAIALLTAALTAFYTSRAYFKTFWGPLRTPPEAGDHPHESPPVMTVPLIVLAVGAVFVGLVFAPLTHWFGDFLSAPAESLDPMLAIASVAAAVLGVGLSAWLHLQSPRTADELASRVPFLYQVSLNRFFIDEIYGRLIVGPLQALAVVSRLLDGLLDGIALLIGQVPRLGAVLLRPIQNGLVQFYALAMVMGLAVFLSFLALRPGR